MDVKKVRNFIIALTPYHSEHGERWNLNDYLDEVLNELDPPETLDFELLFRHVKAYGEAPKSYWKEIWSLLAGFSIPMYMYYLENNDKNNKKPLTRLALMKQ